MSRNTSHDCASLSEYNHRACASDTLHVHARLSSLVSSPSCYLLLLAVVEATNEGTDRTVWIHKVAFAFTCFLRGGSMLSGKGGGFVCIKVLRFAASLFSLISHENEIIWSL